MHTPFILIQPKGLTHMFHLMKRSNLSNTTLPFLITKSA